MGQVTLNIIRADIENCDNLNKYYGIIDTLRAYCEKHGNSKETKELYLLANEKSFEIIEAL